MIRCPQTDQYCTTRGGTNRIRPIAYSGGQGRPLYGLKAGQVL